MKRREFIQSVLYIAPATCAAKLDLLCDDVFDKPITKTQDNKIEIKQEVIFDTFFAECVDDKGNIVFPIKRFDRVGDKWKVFYDRTNYLGEKAHCQIIKINIYDCYLKMIVTQNTEIFYQAKLFDEGDTLTITLPDLIAAKIKNGVLEY